MTTINPEWTENLTLPAFDDTSPLDGVTSKTALDLDSTGPYDLVQIQIKITWHASATDYADLFLYGSPDSGTTDDTEPLAGSRRIDADPGETTYLSIIVRDIPFINIWIQNESNQEIAELSGKYAGRKWSSI